MINVILFLVFSPLFITNLTHYILIFSIIFKNNFITHSLIPLCLTNALYISLTMLFVFDKFDVVDKPEEEKKVLKYFNKYIYIFKFGQILAHFFIPLYIVFSNNHLQRKTHSNVILSLLSSSVVLFIYSLYVDKDIYSRVNLHSKDMIYILPTYLLLLFIMTVFYFY